jgi:hypothetical protein
MEIDVLNEKSHNLTHELIPILNKYDPLTGWIAMTNLIVELCQRNEKSQGEKVSKEGYLDFMNKVWDYWESVRG